MLLINNYLQKVSEYFKNQRKTWNFFAIDKNKEEQLEQFKTELLKNTYKFDEKSDQFIYDKVIKAKELLNLGTLPVTVYQAQYSDELNANIVYLNNEAHIVFSGSITKILNEEELLAVLAHELSHIKLYTMLNGDLEIADRIITSIANNYASEPAWFETARLFRLYTEIFCDRGAYTVLQNIDPIITSLVKASTGLENVNVESYLKQADEILSRNNNFRTAAATHPENFIRAKAVQLWHMKKEEAEKEITTMIEGLADIDQLDIFKQSEISLLTQKFISLMLKPGWFKSVTVMSLAKQYFASFKCDDSILLGEDIVESFKNAHQSVKDYFSYVLMDFAMADPSLEEVPSGWAFQLAENLFLKETFDELIKKELKFSDKKLQQYRQKTLSAYYEVKERDSEQIYDG